MKCRPGHAREVQTLGTTQGSGAVNFQQSSTEDADHRPTADHNSGEQKTAEIKAQIQSHATVAVSLQYYLFCPKCARPHSFFFFSFLKFI